MFEECKIDGEIIRRHTDRDPESEVYLVTFNSVPRVQVTFPEIELAINFGMKRLRGYRG
jgi:hypothetical protein